MAARLAICVAAWIVAAGSMAPAGARMAACSSDSQTIVTFHIEMTMSRSVYTVGDRADMTVTVTRPAHEDPAGNGTEYEPPVSVPAEDVKVQATLYINRALPMSAIGTTDGNGKVLFRFPLGKETTRGIPIARIVATKNYPSVQLACLEPQETGEREYRRPFSVRSP